MLNLKHSLICACPRTVDQGVSTRTTVSTCHSASYEEFLESLPELSRHTTVDSEVDGIRNDDEEIRDQDEDISDMVVEYLDQGTRDYVEDRDYCYGDFNHEEDRDNNDEHQCGAVGVTQPFAFRFSVLLEQFLPVQLRGPHGSEEEDVEDDQRGAGDEMDEEDSETEVRDEVGVH